MSVLVIDASIAIKWLVEERGTEAALSLRRTGRLIAPDLLIAECANVLWKKVRRHELTVEQALYAANLLQHAELELLPTRSLLADAAAIAINLDHPAYDCVYIALAAANDCRFVTADEALVRKLRGNPVLSERVLSLTDAESGNS
jgi:predicted nucleic acid-binding protein